MRGDARAVIDDVVSDLKAATRKKTGEDAVEAVNDVIIDSESLSHVKWHVTGHDTFWTAFLAARVALLDEMGSDERL